MPPLRTPGFPRRCWGSGRAGAAPTELADWQVKAAAIGVPLSALLRQAMARTRMWTAPAVAGEREL